MSLDVLDRSLQGVEGWLHLDEARMLYEVVLWHPSQLPLTIVEIGSWKGRSTIALAAGLKARARTGGQVWAIDPHAGNVEHVRRWGAVDTFNEFLDNVARAGVAEFVRPLRMTSHDARSQFADGTVDVLFVDGSHEFDDVIQDIDDWAPTLADGATIAFNDTSWPGVHRALRERVTNGPSRFRNPRLVRSTLFLDYRRSARWTTIDDRALVRLRLALAARRQAGRLVKRLPGWVKRAGNRVTATLVS